MTPTTNNSQTTHYHPLFKSENITTSVNVEPTEEISPDLEADIKLHSKWCKQSKTELKVESNSNIYD